MSDLALTPVPPRWNRSRGALLVAALLVLSGGAAGFWIVWSGLLFEVHPRQERSSTLAELAFLPMEPVVVPLGPAGGGRMLRLTAQLEVNRRHLAEVKPLLPRFRDVLNTYLRAVPVATLEEPTSLTRLRGQMLRRLQMISGEGRVRDLLISEFIID